MYCSLRASIARDIWKTHDQSIELGQVRRVGRGEERGERKREKPGAAVKRSRGQNGRKRPSIAMGYTGIRTAGGRATQPLGWSVRGRGQGMPARRIL